MLIGLVLHKRFGLLIILILLTNIPTNHYLMAINGQCGSHRLYIRDIRQVRQVALGGLKSFLKYH